MPVRLSTRTTMASPLASLPLTLWLSKPSMLVMESTVNPAIVTSSPWYMSAFSSAAVMALRWGSPTSSSRIVTVTLPSCTSSLNDEREPVTWIRSPMSISGAPGWNTAMPALASWK